MADFIYNFSLGDINGRADRVDDNDPTNSALIVMLLSAADTDGTHRDVDDFSALLATSATETTATSYARKVLTDSDIAGSTVDDAGDTRSTDISDQTWSSIGGTTDTALTDMVVGYDSDTTGGTDANIEPISQHDFVLASTNGGDVVAQINASGLWSASSTA